jgi:hypothetical protein
MEDRLIRRTQWRNPHLFSDTGKTRCSLCRFMGGLPYYPEQRYYMPGPDETGKDRV